MLIANRGEIACRILRTCRNMGIKSIAIYSDIDRNSLHVVLADEAYEVGPAPSFKSYLNVENIIAVAKRSKADAIHPGYGFLSESADFAQRVKDEGLIFIGPTTQNIIDMGEKIRSRNLMKEAGVPTLPGTNEVKTEKEVAEAAKKIGFPILIKASSGGGGKGIQVVKRKEDIASALRLCISSGFKFFKNSSVFVEKYIEQAKHIEIQVLRDTHGNTVHLYDRECSCQRRHQKILEEAPSISISEQARQELTKVSIKAANHINYIGVGTLEFILDAKTGECFFLEMNTRLQVEHPVTEMITGIDLVKMQILVADEQPLPLSQSDIFTEGHAIEARICAEDSQTFLPSPGTIHSCRHPQAPFVRVDSCAYPGTIVPVHYDPMIGKIISWGKTREEAMGRMSAALQELMITGIKTNQILHKNILEHPKFKSGTYTTKLAEKIALDSKTKDFFKYIKDEIFIISAAIHAYEDIKTQQFINSEYEETNWKKQGLNREHGSGV